MNARQTKKRLKSRIRELEGDNNLMRRIIADSPTMQELYDLYNQPLNVVHTSSLKHYRIKKAFEVSYHNLVRGEEYIYDSIAQEIKNIVKQYAQIEGRSGYAFDDLDAKPTEITFDFWVDGSNKHE